MGLYGIVLIELELELELRFLYSFSDNPLVFAMDNRRLFPCGGTGREGCCGWVVVWR